MIFFHLWRIDPAPNSDTMTSACGKRILAPYTRPLRAPLMIERIGWLLGSSRMFVRAVRRSEAIGNGGSQGLSVRWKFWLAERRRHPTLDPRPRLCILGRDAGATSTSRTYLPCDARGTARRVKVHAYVPSRGLGPFGAPSKKPKASANVRTSQEQERPRRARAGDEQTRTARCAVVSFSRHVCVAGSQPKGERLPSCPQVEA